MTALAYLSWPPPTSPPRTEARLLLWQGGCCAMCAEESYCLVRDHDHATGLLRGWLCRGCNYTEASSGSDTWQWHMYRRFPPAMYCGAVLRYGDAPRSPPKTAPWDDVVRRVYDETFANEMRRQEASR